MEWMTETYDEKCDDQPGCTKEIEKEDRSGQKDLYDLLADVARY
jgi:hypothetical protein